MKRSTQIGLVSIGVVLAAGVVSYSGDGGERVIYPNLAACKWDGKLSAADCEARFAEAKAVQTRDVRRFANRSACEDEFGAGRCESVAPTSAGSSGVGAWAPVMAGVMLAGGAAAAQPLLPVNRGNCPPGQSPPCETSGSSSGGHGGSSSYSTHSGRRIEAQRVAGSERLSVRSRGGFGGLGHGFSSGS